MTALNSVVCSDALDFLRGLDAGSVNLILCDPPYGSTACDWDQIIPLEDMWSAIKRVVKPRGAVVFTASQPFTTRLIASNFDDFRYEWIWQKSNGGGFLNANRQPLKRHENILVFYDAPGYYAPQFDDGEPYRCRRAAAGETTQDQTVAGWITVNDGFRYPTTVLDFANDTGLHPTQKPVSLFRYLIRTYTRPGELVVDPTCGSGTTAVAARAEGRNFIVNDNSPHYVGVTLDRLRLPFEPRAERPSDLSGLPMFEHVEVAK